MFKKIIIFFLLAILLAGGGGFGYYVWAKNNQVTIPFLEKPPQEVVKLMMEKSEKLSAMEFEQELNLEIELDPEKLSRVLERKQDRIKNFISYLQQEPRVLGMSNIQGEQVDLPQEE